MLITYVTKVVQLEDSLSFAESPLFVAFISASSSTPDVRKADAPFRPGGVSNNGGNATRSIARAPVYCCGCRS